MDVASTPRLAFRVEAAAQAAGLSRSLLYAAMVKGDLRSMKVGSARLILADDLSEWLKSHREATPTAAGGAT